MDPDPDEVYYGDYGYDDEESLHRKWCAQVYDEVNGSDLAVLKNVDKFKAFKEGDELEYQKMWPVVEEICRSLLNGSNDWEQEDNTLLHKPSKLRYWTGASYYCAVTELRKSGGDKKVFSDKQGVLIRAAAARWRMERLSNEQMLVAKSFFITPLKCAPEPGFWCNLWVSIKFLPTLARFCMAR